MFSNLLDVIFQDGLMYALLAMGYYVSYTILDFPDLTVEGTVLTGGVTFGILVKMGVNPWSALIIAFIIGFLFGTVTGGLHAKLGKGRASYRDEEQYRKRQSASGDL